MESRFTNAVPTQAQVAPYYDAHRATYTEPALRRGAMIFIEVPAKSSAENKTHRRGAHQGVPPGPDAASSRGFGALAVEYSEDQATRYKGGDLGWIQAQRGDARFELAVSADVFALACPGDLREVIERPRGFYLLKLLDSRPETVKSQAAVQPAIEHQLLLQNRERLEADWKKQARAASPIEVFPDVLNRVPAPAGHRLPATDAPPGLP